MALGKNSIALLAHLAAVKEFSLYCCSGAHALFPVRNSGVLDSGGGVLAKASLYLTEKGGRCRRGDGHAANSGSNAYLGLSIFHGTLYHAPQNEERVFSGVVANQTAAVIRSFLTCLSTSALSNVTLCRCYPWCYESLVAVSWFADEMSLPHLLNKTMAGQLNHPENASHNFEQEAHSSSPDAPFSLRPNGSVMWHPSQRPTSSRPSHHPAAHPWLPPPTPFWY